MSTNTDWIAAKLDKAEKRLDRLNKAVREKRAESERLTKKRQQLLKHHVGKPKLPPQIGILKNKIQRLQVDIDDLEALRPEFEQDVEALDRKLDHVKTFHEMIPKIKQGDNLYRQKLDNFLVAANALLEADPSHLQILRNLILNKRLQDEIDLQGYFDICELNPVQDSQANESFLAKLLLPYNFLSDFLPEFVRQIDAVIAETEKTARDSMFWIHRYPSQRKTIMEKAAETPEQEKGLTFAQMEQKKVLEEERKMRQGQPKVRRSKHWVKTPGGYITVNPEKHEDNEKPSPRQTQVTSVITKSKESADNVPDIVITPEMANQIVRTAQRQKAGYR